MSDFNPELDLEAASTADLEAEHQRLDALSAAVRERKILIDGMIARRHGEEAAAARVANMDPGERQALTVALRGVESAEAVGQPGAAPAEAES